MIRFRFERDVAKTMSLFFMPACKRLIDILTFKIWKYFISLVITLN